MDSWKIREYQQLPRNGCLAAVLPKHGLVVYAQYDCLGRFTHYAALNVLTGKTIIFDQANPTTDWSSPRPDLTANWYLFCGVSATPNGDGVLVPRWPQRMFQEINAVSGRLGRQIVLTLPSSRLVLLHFSCNTDVIVASLENVIGLRCSVYVFSYVSGTCLAVVNLPHLDSLRGFRIAAHATGFIMHHRKQRKLWDFTSNGRLTATVDTVALSENASAYDAGYIIACDHGCDADRAWGGVWHVGPEGNSAHHIVSLHTVSTPYIKTCINKCIVQQDGSFIAAPHCGRMMFGHNLRLRKQWLQLCVTCGI